MNPNPPTIFDMDVNLINTSTDYDFTWWYYLDDTVADQHSSIPVVNLPTNEPVEICLTVQNIYGCEDDTCQTLVVDNELLLYVPNAILLDGYSDNNVFKPVSNFFHPDYYNMYIFNRWGELIFETDQVDQGWDGTYNNVFVQDGVYVWKIVGAPLDNDSDLREYTGHVTVLK